MQDSTMLGVTVCVLVAGEQEHPLDTPQLLPTRMSEAASYAGSGVTGTWLVSVLLYSDPALKGSSCLPARFLPVWIVKVP